MNDETTRYEVTYFKDYAVTGLDSQPCWFFRVMQRWLLGWRWTRLDAAKDNTND